MAAPKFVRSVYLKLFSLRRVEFVTLDAHVAERHGIRPGRAIKVIILTTPTIRSLLVGFVLNTAVIGLFFAAAVYKLSPGDYAAAIGPTLIFGTHATCRMCWKVRERVAMQAHWPVRVARQKQGFLAIAACMGLVVGVAGMFLFLSSLTTPVEKPVILTACIVTGAVEMIRNSIRIGGKTEIANFNIDDHAYYFPDED